MLVLPDICDATNYWLFTLQVFFYEIFATFLYVFCILKLKNNVS